jgi:hypothetical protein
VEFLLKLDYHHVRCPTFRASAEDSRACRGVVDVFINGSSSYLSVKMAITNAFGSSFRCGPFSCDDSDGLIARANYHDARLASVSNVMACCGIASARLVFPSKASGSRDVRTSELDKGFQVQNCCFSLVGGGWISSMVMPTSVVE